MNKQTEKEKSDYMFKFAINITPKPFKRDGGKRCRSSPTSTAWWWAIITGFAFGLGRGMRTGR